MRSVESFRVEAEAQGLELLRSIDAAEAVIVSTIERECEALRAGQMLAANALRLRLRDAAKLYLNVIRAARASLWTLERVLPGTRGHLDSRRRAFAALLKVELAVLAAERTVAENELQFASASHARVAQAKAPTRPQRVRGLRHRRAG